MLLNYLLSDISTTLDVSNHTGEKFRRLFDKIGAYVGYNVGTPLEDVDSLFNPSNQEIANTWNFWLNGLIDEIEDNNSLPDSVSNILLLLSSICKRSVEVINNGYVNEGCIIEISFFIDATENPDSPTST